jgi:hypothetical protein
MMTQNVASKECKEISAAIEMAKILRAIIGNYSPPRSRRRRPAPPPGMRWMTEKEIKDRDEAKVQAKVMDADAELRIEVVEAMTKAGFAPHVAANLTNTKAKLLEQARKYEVI